MAGGNSPKCNAQAPDRLHLEACGLGSPNPLGIVNVAILVETIAQRRGKVVCTGASVGNLVQILAIEVGKWFANNDSENDQCNQEKSVQASADQEWENVVEVKNDRNRTIQHGNADLCSVSIEWEIRDIRWHSQCSKSQ